MTVHPSTRPIKLGASRLAVRVITGPRRDIVVASSTSVKKKGASMIFKITARTCELLDPKIEKSPTYGDFQNFDPHPQLDIKF